MAVDVRLDLRFAPLLPTRRFREAIVGEGVRVYLVTMDRRTRAPLIASGFSVTIERPVGSPWNLTDADLDDVGTAEPSFELLADDVGDYVITATCSAPAAAADETTVRVRAADAIPPSNQDVLADVDGSPFVTAKGGVITVKRADQATQMPVPLSTTKVLATDGREFVNVPWSGLETAATEAARAHARVATVQDYPIAWFAQDNAGTLGGATLDTDPRKVIQAAIDYCSDWNTSHDVTQQIRLSLEGGRVYSLTSQATDWGGTSPPNAEGQKALRWRSGIKLNLAPTARIEGPFRTVFPYGIICNEDPLAARNGTDRPRDIEVWGGSFGKPFTPAGTNGQDATILPAYKGPVISFCCDHIRFYGTVVDGYGAVDELKQGDGGGMAWCIVGNDVRLVECGILHPGPERNGAGGFRIYGGDGIELLFPFGRTSGDGIQCNPRGGDTAWTNLDISNVLVASPRILNINGRSFIIALSNKNAPPNGFTASIRHVRITGMRGLAGGNCGRIENAGSRGVIEDIAVSDTILSNGLSEDDRFALDIDGPLQLFRQSTDEDWTEGDPVDDAPVPLGGLRAIVFSNTSVSDAFEAAFRVRGNIRGFHLSGLQFNPNTKIGKAMVRLVGNIDGWSVKNLTGECGTTAIQVGNISTAHEQYPGSPKSGVIENADIGGLQDGEYALDAQIGANLEVRRVTARQGEGVTTARGIRVRSGFTKADIDHCDVSAITEAGEKIRNDSDATIGAHNLGYPA